MSRAFFSSILNSLFPQDCLICYQKDTYLCNNCKSSIIFEPKWIQINQLYILSFFDYKQIVFAKLIEQWKYKSDQKAIKIIFELLNKHQAITYVPSRIKYLYPIPLHKRKYLERGFNQSLILANWYKSQNPNLCITDYLKRTEYTKAQATLNKTQRQKNLANKIKLNQYNNDKNINHICLIDDIVTTGSTLQACANTFKLKETDHLFAICLGRSEI